MNQQMPGEFLQQFPRVIGKGRHDVLTLPGRPLQRTTYHITSSVQQMPLIAGTGQATLEAIGSKQAELRTELVQAEQQ